MDNSTATEVAHSVANAAQDPGILTPDVTMMILTWVTFLSLLAILHKFAWKPILDGLDQREKRIRESLENAAKIEEELKKISESKEKIIVEAQQKANSIVEQSRKSAVELAVGIEQKAKEHAQSLLESAHQEIAGERQRVKTALLKESTEVAISLAEKILQENLDKEKNRKIVDQYIKNL